MFAVSETIENEEICVTCHPRIWNREDLLFWPPHGSGIGRKSNVPPGPEWMSFKCRILRDNIETFEEALEVEKMYSKHRNSDSFREQNEMKKFKRDHPVTANLSGMIDMNDEIDKINAEKGSKTTKINDGKDKSSKQPTKHHKECFEKLTSRIPKKPVISVLKRNPFAKPSLKPQLPKAEKIPRYPNYLKSGKKSTAPSSTISKKEYLRLNALDEISDEIEEPVCKYGGRPGTSEKQEMLDTASYTGKGTPFASSPVEHSSVHNPFSRRYEEETELAKADHHFPSSPFETQSNVLNEFAFGESEYENQSNTDGISKAKSKPIILEDVLIKPSISTSIHRSSSFEDTVLRSLNELKNAQKKSEERQALFEARMIVKYDTFVTDMQRAPDRHQSLGQKQNRDPIRPEAHSIDSVLITEEDFDELNAKFPISVRPRVEKLEWAIRRELDFKFRLKSRLGDFIAKNAKKSIRLIMRYLFKDKVLQQYTWNGTSEKRAFKQLTSINNFIYNIINENFKKYKKTEYASYVGQWLKHAKSRQREITYTYPNANAQVDEDDDDRSENDGSDNESEW